MKEIINKIVKNVETNNDFKSEIDNFIKNYKVDNFDLVFNVSKWYGQTPFIYSGEFEGHKFMAEILEVNKWGICQHNYTDLDKFINDLKKYEIDELHKHLNISIISEDDYFEIESIKWDDNTPDEFIKEKQEKWGAFDIKVNSSKEKMLAIVYNYGAVICNIQLILSNSNTTLELNWEY